MIWLLACAIAGPLQWGPVSSWRQVADAEGQLMLPSGMPLLFEGSEPPVVVDAHGLRLDVAATRDGWALPPAPHSRVLSAPGTRVRQIDRRLEQANWATWERGAARAIARAEPLPPTPDGSTRIARRIALRAAAVDRSVAQIGLWTDLHRARGLSYNGRIRGPTTDGVLPAGGSIRAEVDGAYSTVWMRPLTADGFVRTEVEVGAGQTPSETVLLATSGEFRQFRRFAFDSDPVEVTATTTPLEVSITSDRPRPFLFVRDRQVEAGDFSLVEREALFGRVDLEGFRRAYRSDDPVRRAWARVRLIENTEDTVELGDLADLALGDIGLDVIADAVLERASDLPEEVVLGWLERTDDPDPAALATWADNLPSTRPRGLDILDRAQRGRPADRDIARARNQAANEATRWTVLDPEIENEDAVWQWSSEGPGVPRRQFVKGEVGTRQVFTADDALAQRVVFQADAATFSLGNHTVLDADGELVFGIPGGPATLTVNHGSVITDKGWEGGTPVYAWRTQPLPATWTLPDHGAAFELAVRGADDVIMTFDDGRVERAVSGHSVFAGPHARSVTLHGSGRAALLARVVRPAPVEPVPSTGDLALSVVDRTTRELDGGLHHARSERAVALAWLGRRKSAWTDVNELYATHPDLADDAWAQVAAIPVFTPIHGPLDAHTSRLVGNEQRALAFEAMEANDPTAAVLASIDDPQVLDRAARIGRFNVVSRAENGGGLIPVEVEPPPPKSTLSARVDAAILQSPWPWEETLTLNAGGTDFLRAAGGVEVETWCRDTTLQREPCVVNLFGSDEPGLVVRDGDLYDAASSGDTLEIGPVAEGRRMVIRARVGGELLTPKLRKLALAVRGRTRLRVPEKSIVRLDVYRGEVEANGHLAGPLHYIEDGWVVLEGNGAASVAVLDRRPEAPESPEEIARGERPRPVGVLTSDAAWPTLSRRTIPTMGSKWSAIGAGSVHLTRDGQFLDPWFTAQGEATLLHTERKRWTVAQAFVRAPGGGGIRIDQGFGSLHRFLAFQARGATDPSTGAGHVRAHVHGRNDIGSDTLFFRTELWAHVGRWSLQPVERTDPRVWSRYGFIHWMGLTGRAALRVQPWRDARVEVWGIARTNVSPTVDRLEAGLDIDLLPTPRWRIVGGPALRAGLPDLNRQTAFVRPEFRLGVERDVWLGDRHVLAFARAVATPLDITGFAGVRVHFTRGRGLRDIPPTEVPFRALREAR